MGFALGDDEFSCSGKGWSDKGRGGVEREDGGGEGGKVGVAGAFVGNGFGTASLILCIHYRTTLWVLDWGPLPGYHFFFHGGNKGGMKVREKRKRRVGDL